MAPPRPENAGSPAALPATTQSANVAVMNPVALELVQRLVQAGHTAYLAGGCVRDYVRGVPATDYDIATSATPEQVQQLFSHTVPVGAQFGVVVVCEQDQSFEVATFRSEEAYLDGRRPSAVHYGSARADAERRDFTINGLFYDPATDQVIDYVGGRADLEAGLVRTIGDAERRFDEDKLRLLRCVRFAATLGFEIDPSTFTAVQHHAAEIAIVSAERVRDELIKIFCGPHAARGLDLLDASGLLEVILPEVSAMKGVEQPPAFHPEGDVFTHVRLMLAGLPANCDEILAFAVLLHDVGKPPTFERAPDRIRFNNHDRIGAEMAEQILGRLRFPNRVIDQVVTCVAEHMRLRHVREMRVAKLKRVLQRDSFVTELELHRLDCEASHGALDNYAFLKQKSEELPPETIKPRPLVTGHDLLALGMTPGPVVGRILRELEEQQLDEQLASREAALEYARRRAAELGGIDDDAGDSTAPTGSG